MERHESALFSLKLVAALFILGGIWAILEVIIRLTLGNLYLNVGVLELVIGLQLLRFSRGWRTFGLVLLWIGLIALPLFALSCLLSDVYVNFRFLGQRVGVPQELGVALSAGWFTLTLWQYRVLTRPDIRKLFGLAPHQTSPPPKPGENPSNDLRGSSC